VCFRGALLRLVNVVVAELLFLNAEASLLPAQGLSDTPLFNQNIIIQRNFFLYLHNKAHRNPAM
jgi:hypothetical protein